MGSSRDDELWFVPGFADIVGAADVLAATLQASHMLPPDRVSDLLRRAGIAIGAVDVSMWLIDYGQAFLKPSDDDSGDVGHSDGTIPVTGTAAGRAFARGEPIESDHPVPHRWVPILDGTERLGVLRFEFPAALTVDQRRLSDALTSLGGELLVGKRPHTDRYEMQRRQQDMNLAAELQWQQLPPLESSMPAAAVAGFVEPAYGVGGDGFDYSINGDIMDLTIYDAVGHGLHSALLSTLMIASLRHGRRLRLGLAERLAVADEAISGKLSRRFRHRPGRPVVHGHRQARLGQRRAPAADAGPRRRRRRRADVRAASSRRPASAPQPRRRPSRRSSCNAPTGCSSTPTGWSRAAAAADPGSVSSGWPTSWRGRTPKAWGVLRRSGNWATRFSSMPTMS